MSTTPRIKFNCNIEKALEVIIWFAIKKPDITVLPLLKLLFFADMLHLNKYGRPIIGDDYVAMVNGPVASNTYDLLKGQEYLINQIEDDLGFKKDGYKVIATREPDTKKLSESDLECLQQTLTEYGHYTPTQLVDLTHEYEAWHKAWYNRSSNNPLMDYADFFMEENKFYIEDLVEECEFLKI